MLRSSKSQRIGQLFEPLEIGCAVWARLNARPAQARFGRGRLKAASPTWPATAGWLINHALC
jgi:hypothetical protein